MPFHDHAIDRENRPRTRNHLHPRLKRLSQNLPLNSSFADHHLIRQHFRERGQCSTGLMLGGALDDFADKHKGDHRHRALKIQRCTVMRRAIPEMSKAENEGRRRA